MNNSKSFVLEMTDVLLLLALSLLLKTILFIIRLQIYLSLNKLITLINKYYFHYVVVVVVVMLLIV